MNRPLPKLSLRRISRHLKPSRRHRIETMRRPLPKISLPRPSRRHWSGRPNR